MKSRILAGALLFLTVAVGFYLPSFVSGIQDRIQAQHLELQPLPPEQTQADEDTPSADMPDARTALERLTLFQNSGRYISLDSRLDGADVAQAAANVIEHLKNAGIITDDDFETVSATVQVSVPYDLLDQSMTLWTYVGRTAKDKLTVVIDADTGIAMSINLTIQNEADSESMADEDIWSRWSEFFQSYYQLYVFRDASATETTDMQRTYIFSDGAGVFVELPLKAFELVQSSSPDSPLLYSSIYRFN